MTKTVGDYLSHVSKSTVMTLKLCQRMFYYSYILKLPQAPPKAVTMKGISAHRFFQEYYDHVNLDEIKSEKHSDVIKYFLGVAVDLKNGDNNFQKWIDKSILENWVVFNTVKFFKDRDSVIPIARELKFKGKFYTGTIDRVEKGEDGSVVICDYKPSTDWADPFEIYFYSVLYGENIRNHITKGYIWGYKTNSYKYVNITSAVRKLVDNRVKKLLDFSGPFLPNHSGICGFCDYSEQCKKQGSMLKLK